MKVSAALAAIRAFVDAANGAVVTEAEVSRRMKICDQCPKRQPVTGILSGISQKLGIASQVHQVPEWVQKSKCGVCKCALGLLLPATSKNLHRDSPEEAAIRAKQAPKCWLTAAAKSA